MQPAKMSIDPKFIELTADVFSRLLLKYSVERGGGSTGALVSFMWETPTRTKHMVVHCIWCDKHYEDVRRGHPAPTF